jgi:lysophospholipase L1-like esterase
MKRLPYFRLFLLLLGLLSLTACDSGGGGSSAPTPQTILVMGDSISASGTYAGVRPWPGIMDGMVAEWTVVSRARGGERMEEGASRLSGQLAAVNPDSLVIFYGSNNAIQSNTAGFESGLRLSIQLAKDSGVSRVVVCTIPPMFGPRSIFNGTVTALNQTIQSVAGELGAGVAYIDREFNPATDANLFPDGLHPNGDAQAIIAMTVRERL